MLFFLFLFYIFYLEKKEVQGETNHLLSLYTTWTAYRMKKIKWDTQAHRYTDCPLPSNGNGAHRQKGDLLKLISFTN
jgi:hypothetical protein